MRRLIILLSALTIFLSSAESFGSDGSPSISHTPLFRAIAGSNKLITVRITDDKKVEKAELYFRASGVLEFRVIEMTKIGDVYSQRF